MKELNCYLKLKDARVEGLGYKVFLPADFDAAKKYPLMLFLHGAGERGDGTTQLDRVLAHGPVKYAHAGTEYPCILIAPQCPENRIWPDLADEVGKLLDNVAGEYPVDLDRVSCTGLSMGGFGTFTMGITFPGRFAALGPICGGGVAWCAPYFGKTPIWAFHGDADSLVSVENSLMMYNSVKTFGGNMELTLVHGCDHDSWTFAYERTRLIEWLIAARRS